MNVFKSNICSKNARLVCEVNHIINSSVWSDRHYINRLEDGDENGTREGIDIADVKQLVEETFNHVICYSLKYGSIVNFPPFVLNKSTRIVLKQILDGGEVLNVAVEYHFFDVNTYEITVWTAMKVDQFFIRDGQYVVELHHDKTKLMRNVNKKITLIMELDRL
jgi:hypothetical protein